MRYLLLLCIFLAGCGSLPEGDDGRDGRDGESGEQGPIGPGGEDGANGEDGEDGEDGADAVVGSFLCQYKWVHGEKQYSDFVYTGYTYINGDKLVSLVKTYHTGDFEQSIGFTAMHPHYSEGVKEAEVKGNIYSAKLTGECSAIVSADPFEEWNEMECDCGGE